MLDAILEFSSIGNMPSVFSANKVKSFSTISHELPQRMEGNHLYRYDFFFHFSAISSGVSSKDCLNVQKKDSSFSLQFFNDKMRGFLEEGYLVSSL